MSFTERLLKELDAELPVTRRVLERVPDERGEWKPHEKSFPMAHLAQLVARMPGWIVPVVDQDNLDFAPEGGPPMPGYSIEATATLLADFDRNAAAARAAVARFRDDQCNEPWALKAGGQVLMQTTRYEMLRQSINHLVHHRAQLGVYLRMCDVPVPSMYGPTADEPWEG